jgi:hypothetical protein
MNSSCRKSENISVLRNHVTQTLCHIIYIHEKFCSALPGCCFDVVSPLLLLLFDVLTALEMMCRNLHASRHDQSRRKNIALHYMYTFILGATFLLK